LDLTLRAPDAIQIADAQRRGAELCPPSTSRWLPPRERSERRWSFV